MLVINKEKYVLKRFKTISYLKNLELKSDNNTAEMRKNIKICVLDDQGFASDNLRKLGYNNIKVMENFNDIKDFEEFQLVLCDVDGIGSTLSPIKQGLDIAYQISNLYYPKTIVAIYSGKNLSEYDYEENENITIIEKNITTTELSRKIDELCSFYWTPTKMWDILEKYFRKEKLSNIEIAVIEDNYIKSVESKDYNLFLIKVKEEESIKNI